MKSIFFVDHGIPEYFDKRGKPTTLSTDEIKHIVRPLTDDIKVNIEQNGRLVLICANDIKSRQAAVMLGKGLGGIRPIYRCEVGWCIDCNSLSTIIQQIPNRKNQIIIFGIKNIENLLDLWTRIVDNNSIDSIKILEDKDYCPYEIRKINITNERLCQIKQSLTH